MIDINSKKNEIIVGPKNRLIKRNIKLRDLNLLVNRDYLKDKIIYSKIRSTGNLIKSKLKYDEQSTEVELLEDEYGISPGQACVFYEKDDLGERLMGGGWISN